MYEGDPSEDYMDNTEPEPTIYYNHARLPAVGLGYQSSHTIFDPQPTLPARGAGAMVTQSLWECLAYDWFNLRPISGQGAHARHCLDDQDQETGWLRDL